MSAEELPPKKKVPTWVWVLGSGCAVLMVAGIVAVLFTLRFVSRAKDPEVQWPKVALHLPFDAEPDGWTITSLPTPGTEAEIWLLHAPGADDQITLSCYPKAEAPTMRKVLFAEEELAADAPIVGPVGRFDPVRSTALVQGRELVVLRYFTTPDLPEKPDGLLGAIQTAAATSNLLAELSTEPDGALVVLEIRRQGKREPIPDADLVQLLQPFRIGSKQP